MQALHQQFFPRDRSKVAEILDPNRKLLAEGPLLEVVPDDKGEGRKVLRYMILFSDSLLAASKDGDDKLHLEWRVNLYASSVTFLPAQSAEKGSDNCIRIVERTVTTGFPLSVICTYDLYPFQEGPFSMSYWAKHLQSFADGPNELYHLTHTGITKARLLQKNLLSPEDWQLLTSNGAVVGYQESDSVQHEGSLVDSISIIQHGKCCVTKDIKGKQIILGVMDAGELFGEMNFLSESASKEATASVVADRPE